MKQSGMCLSLLLFGATCAHAQVTQQWVAEFGPGNGVDVANAIAVDAAGNVYVTGWSWGGPYYPHYATLKYSQL